MTRVAAVDCGTNSIRLLIADIDPRTHSLVDLERRMEIVRLGENVDRTGEFAPDALQRAFAACGEFARLIALAGCERVRVVATSATRDVRNRAEFVAGVRDLLGVEPEVISGQQEAELSFLGATRELEPTTGDGPSRDPFLVVDIGGGSTEFVLGPAGGAAERSLAVSVDVGCVRLTERHLLGDPAAAAQIAAAQVEVDQAIEAAARTVPIREGRTLVGLAGSVTTVAAMALDLPAYDADVLHHSRISATDVHDVASRLLEMTHAERAALPFMHPGRVDVIGAGALILSRIVAAVDAEEVLVSEHDILDGIAFSVAEPSHASES